MNADHWADDAIAKSSSNVLASNPLIFTFAGIYIGWYYIKKFSDLKITESIRVVANTSAHIFNKFIKRANK